MTALPAVAEFTGSTVTEAQFKTAITNLRGFLSGLLGSDGEAATALSTIGSLGGKVSSKTAAYTVLAADRGTVLHCSGTFTLTLTAAATLASGFSFAVINTGTGAITIDPNAAELIDGAATKVLTAGQSCIVTCTGTGFFAISGGGGDADTVDGFHASQSVVVNNVAVRDASGNLAGNVLGNAATATTATTVASASISQSKLKTATGVVSTTSTTGEYLALPGGEYAYNYQLRSSDAAFTAIVTSLGGNILVTGSTAYIRHRIVKTSGAGGIAYLQERYVQASPPYNLGDGEIPLFVFALVDKNGTVKAMYTAPEAPWHNNGPTSIKPDVYGRDGRRFKCVRHEFCEEMFFQDPSMATHKLVEITQAVKQADMPIIPHPFLGNDLTGLTVVLIDPVSDHTWRAAELFADAHDEHHDLYYKNKLTIDNARLNRKGPPGVQVAGVRWKNSK